MRGAEITVRREEGGVRGEGRRERGGSRGLQVNERLVIPDDELVVRATRSGGPGGQHVNTSSTRIEIVWNVIRSPVLDIAQRTRIARVLASRLDAHGQLRVVASDTRSQLRNREIAATRLAELVRRALIVPKIRKKTRPPRGAVEKRLAAKKRRSAKKRERRERDEE